MRKITLNSGTDAQAEAVSSTISFRNGDADVSVGFESENYSFSLIIMDGTENEVYSVDVSSSSILVAMQEFSLDRVSDTELLLMDIKDALNRLDPQCSREEAYYGI